MCRYLRRQPPSNMGSRNGSLPDLEGTGFRACTMEEKINEIYLQLPLFIQYAARIENCVQTLRQTVAAQSTKITNFEQIVGPCGSRHFFGTKTQLRVPVAQIQQDLGTCLGRVTAPQPLGPSGPIAQGRLMTVEIQGVDLIRSQAPKMNKHEVPSYFGSLPNNTTKGLRSRSMIFGKNPTCQHTTNLSEFIARQVLCRSGSYSRAKCQDFVAQYKDDGISFEINSPFCCVKTTITVRQSKSIEDRESGKEFAPLWRELADQLKSLFPDGDDEGAFIVPALDARSHVLSIKDRSNGVGKPVLKLASLGSGQLFTLVAPDLSVLGVSPEVLQRVLSKANTTNVWWPPFRLLAFFAAWRVEAYFSAAYVLDGFFTLFSLWLAV